MNIYKTIINQSYRGLRITTVVMFNDLRTGIYDDGKLVREFRSNFNDSKLMITNEAHKLVDDYLDELIFDRIEEKRFNAVM